MIESHFTKVGALRVQYDTAGVVGSPVLLFIHGWASSSRMWHVAMEGLAADFYCVAPDLPGFGESEKPPASWYSLPNYLDFVTGFCDALDLPPADVAGHSMGGLIALALAALHPERVRRLAAVNPAVSGQVWLNLGRFAHTPVRGALLAAARALWPVAISPLLSWPLHDKYVTGPGMRRRREELARSSADAVLGTIRVVATSDLTGRLAGIIAPTLIVVGERDATVPPSQGRLAAERIPGARLVSLPTGHLPGDERPAEFLAALRGFLNGASLPLPA